MNLGPFRSWILVGLLAAVPSAAGDSDIPAAASSVHSGEFLPDRAFDGDPKTRWASRGGGEEWLQVDLGKRVRIPSVAILWEAACAAEYEVQVSDDGKAWRTLARETQGKGGRAVHGKLDGAGRWLRILCRKPGPHGIYSIWEVELPDRENEGLLRAALERGRQEAAREVRARLEAMASALDRLGVREVVFAAREIGPDGHWYANFAYFAPSAAQKCYRKRGRLSKLDVKTGKVAHLVDDPEGTVRDPVVHYDADRILFSYRPGAEEHFHLYEIRLDGTGLKKLTDGPYDDFEPVYLPDGGILFVSSRCRRWVNCWLTQVAVLHRCDADGKNIRPLSANIEQDNTPWVLPDGRVLYQRWEYVDRSQVDYHHLWTTNPDGTGQMVYFGNMHPGSVFIDAKPIPGTDRVLLISSPGHGQREHAGHVATVTPDLGPDHRPSLRPLTAGSDYRDPYPLDEDSFLVARGRQVLFMNGRGEERVLYELTSDFGGAELHEPRPVLRRGREPAVPPRVNPARKTGTLVMADVNIGRNMAGIKRGEIRKLLVLESLPKPVNYTGGMDPISYGGTFTLERILGTVPVEEDGSAHFDLPANRAFFFVALDGDGLSVKRMQSFCSVAPGEIQSCVGCHESRTKTAMLPQALIALRRPPSAVEPVAGVPDVLDFPRDVQPILDRHCARCHDYDRPAGASRPEEGPHAGGVILTGDRGPMFSHSYFNLTLRRQFSDGRDDPRSNFPPRGIGTAASPLMKKLDGGHYGAKLSPREVDVVRYWIETGAAYPGTYAALGSGMIGGYASNNQVEVDVQWPEANAAAEAVRRRCAGCHAGPRALPLNLSDEIGISFWRMSLNDPRLPYSRHRVFNLTRPGKSLMALAPLAKAAGGHGTCAGKGAPVFADAKDPDYAKILALGAAGRRRLEGIKRFDMAGFRPPEPYLREMKRYGVLKEVPKEGERIDPYALDRAYWRQFEYLPGAGGD
jgi:hypothetical protein